MIQEKYHEHKLQKTDADKKKKPPAKSVDPYRDDFQYTDKWLHEMQTALAMFDRQGLEVKYDVCYHFSIIILY